jgi:transcriptional regulator of heat shock response
MTPRTSQILEAVIEDFIETGEPVSSGRLYERHNFGIKPAMIRLELDALEDAGYLEQPHHSAGRVPTDLGYEFFVKQILAKRNTEPLVSADNLSSDLRRLCERHAWADLIEELSAELGLLGVVADLRSDIIYKNGLHALVDNLDWENHATIRSVIRDFEEVDGRMSRASEKIGWPASSSRSPQSFDGRPGRTEPQVFIGKKSPVTRSDDLAVIGGNYQIGDATVSIFAIGPKRMDYRKTIRVFRSL